MRALPISDEMLAAEPGAQRVVIGESDPTRDDVRPCEYLVVESDIYPGAPACLALIELDDADRSAIAEGAQLILRLDGGELPWSLTTRSIP